MRVWMKITGVCVWIIGGRGMKGDWAMRAKGYGDEDLNRSGVSG